jgi:SAM-dependent methyltransferase
MPFALSEKDKAAIRRHHSARRPRLFADNFPWDDAAFTRRFTQLTDVRRSYWGPAAPDVDRIEAILGPAGRRRRHVVDLCCGAGRHVIELAARGIPATGIDISPYAIRRARSRAAANPAVPRGDARFIEADVLSMPDTDPADLIAILCEQIVNFSPAQAADLVGAWSARTVRGGAMVVETPTELPPSSEDLYWMEEPLFLDRPCWVLHTQTSDPEGRTLLELFTCLREPGESPLSFVNSRKYYTAGEIAELAPRCTAQVVEIAASPPRLELAWTVLRRS